MSAIAHPGLRLVHSPVRLGRDKLGILVNVPRAVLARLGRAPHRGLHSPDRIAQPGNGSALLKLAAVGAVEADSLGPPGPVVLLRGDPEAERRADSGGAVGVCVVSQRAGAGSARVEPEDPPVLLLLEPPPPRAPPPAAPSGTVRTARTRPGGSRRGRPARPGWPVPARPPTASACPAHRPR